MPEKRCRIELAIVTCQRQIETCGAMGLSSGLAPAMSDLFLLDIGTESCGATIGAPPLKSIQAAATKCAASEADGASQWRIASGVIRRWFRLRASAQSQRALGPTCGQSRRN